MTTTDSYTDLDPALRTIGGLWLAALERWPDRAFLRFGEERYTVRQMHDHVLDWIATFDRAGLERGAPVAILMRNCADYVALLIAIGASGRVAVPINAELTGELLAYPLLDSGARLVVVDAEREAMVRSLALEPAPVVIVAGKEADPAATPAPSDAPALFAQRVRDIARSEPSTILYTSGTTGPPKGAVLPQEYFAFLGWSSASSNRFIDGDVVFVVLPLFHINAQASLFGAMLSGIEIALEPKFSAATFWRRVRDTGATHLSLIGLIGNILMQRPPEEFVPDHRVRMAIVIPAPDPVDAFERRFQLEIFSNAYGMTEAPVCPPGRCTQMSRPGFIGQAMDYYDVALADDDDQLLGTEQVGEIVVRPRLPNIMFHEYLGRPEATVAAWRNLWFHTGDLARRDINGDYWFVGRKKECIRRRGENIAPIQIENVVLKLPGLVEAAAVAVPAKLGEDEIKLVVALRDGANLAPDAIWRACAEGLPRHMWPAYVEIVPHLPKNASHRVMRDQLAGLGGPGVWAATTEAAR
ncbi:AMP-binding protein [Rhizorhabdus wittichii]|nr:AMP-binding protein [Rhizorhabdus wittichii]